jgi:hypothetical protein
MGSGRTGGSFFVPEWVFQVGDEKIYKILTGLAKNWDYLLTEAAEPLAVNQVEGEGGEGEERILVTAWVLQLILARFFGFFVRFWYVQTPQVFLLNYLAELRMSPQHLEIWRRIRSNGREPLGERMGVLGKRRARFVSHSKRTSSRSCALFCPDFRSNWDLWWCTTSRGKGEEGKNFLTTMKSGSATFL